MQHETLAQAADGLETRTGAGDPVKLRSFLVYGAVVVAAATVLGVYEAETVKIDGPLITGEIITRTYQVSGDNLADLEWQMGRKGPNGHWAYTRTNWNWDSDCNMTFVARITMPELVGRHRLNAEELAEWDRMIEALRAHEMGHVEIGRAWATEIRNADCSDVDRIDRKWSGMDARFDRRTDHGRTQGVYLGEP